MANGFRITEAEDSRITEEGDVRVTEGFFEGVVSLTAVAGIVAASLGVFTPVETSSQLSASSALQANGDVLTLGDADLIGEGTVTSEAVVVASGVVALTGTGSLTSDSFFGVFADSDLNAGGTASFTGQAVFNGEFKTFSEEAFRITEEEDNRITEDGDFRITDLVVFNSGVGSLVVTSTKIPFTSQPFVKLSNNWEMFTPYVKNNNVWQEPEAMYRKENGLWRRIY